jgi:organic radical activating enzyme
VVERLIVIAPPIEGNKLKKFIEMNDSEKRVIAISHDILTHHIAMIEDGVPEITYENTIRLCNSGEADGVIIDSLSFLYPGRLNRLIKMLKNRGVGTIYVPPASYLRRLDRYDKRFLFDTYLQYKTIFTLQLFLINKCNLNCKNCSHFSPLVKKSEYYNPKDIENDLKRLSKLGLYINEIDLIGGEPLLYDEDDLVEVIRKCSTYYPDTSIIISTNGLLLKKISRKLIDTVNEYNVAFSITRYPVVNDVLDELLKFLDENALTYYISEEVKEFFKRYTLREQDPQTAYERCYNSKYCINMLNGRISSCYVPFSVHYFNEYYDKDFFNGDKGMLNIHEATGDEIMEFISKATDCCKYCGSMINEKWDLWSSQLDKDYKTWLVE